MRWRGKLFPPPCRAASPRSTAEATLLLTVEAAEAAPRFAALARLAEPARLAVRSGAAAFERPLAFFAPVFADEGGLDGLRAPALLAPDAFSVALLDGRRTPFGFFDALRAFEVEPLDARVLDVRDPPPCEERARSPEVARALARPSRALALTCARSERSGFSERSALADERARGERRPRLPAPDDTSSRLPSPDDSSSALPAPDDTSSRLPSPDDSSSSC
jgi:hypothetical protein